MSCWALKCLDPASFQGWTFSRFKTSFLFCFFCFAFFVLICHSLSCLLPSQSGRVYVCCFVFI